jgi:hypothetical protein
MEIRKQNNFEMQFMSISLYFSSSAMNSGAHLILGEHLKTSN